MDTITSLTTTPAPASPWTGLPLPPIDPKAVEEALTVGDLAKMQPHVRIAYYLAVCQSAGLNPLTRPFTALKGQDGRVILYANKDCAEQLRKIHRVSLRIMSRERVDELYIVTVRGWTPDGREDEAQGIIEIERGMRGVTLSNAMLRAETKAKRRVTFSLCGLGFPSVDELPRTQEVPLALTTGALAEEPPEMEDSLPEPEEAAAAIPMLFGDRGPAAASDGSPAPEEPLDATF